MKKFITFLLCASFAFLSYNASAQDDIDDLFRGEEALNDSRKLIEAYSSPFMKALGIGMANGWYNTAKPHKAFGVDITVTANGVRIPDKDLFYDAASLNLQSVELVSVDGDASATSAPTVFGPDAEVRFRYTNSSTGISEEFTGPGGIGLEDEIGTNFVPVPMVNLGIGIFKNTDLKIRYIPKIDQDDFTFNLWGVGLMHDVKQYLPVVKVLPFDLSAFVGYTSMDFEYDLSESTTSGENQRATLESRALTVQGLISKKFSILTLYGGLGFNHVKTGINILGTYRVQDEAGNDVSIEDPVKDMDFMAGGPRITAGMRLKLLILTLHADYTVQKYSTLTVGVGLSVR